MPTSFALMLFRKRAEKIYEIAQKARHLPPRYKDEYAILEQFYITQTMLSL